MALREAGCFSDSDPVKTASNLGLCAVIHFSVYLVTALQMPENAKIIQFGSSVGIALNRPVLEKVYGLTFSSDVEIDYSKPPEIIIRPVKKK